MPIPAPPSTPAPASALRDDDGRLQRGRRSRVRIRAAARGLFAEQGFDGATLRAIAERAGMGASSIYRHVRSKEELLVQELADQQEEAWTSFRRGDDRGASTRERVRRFFQAQHELLAQSPDLTVIALRAMSYPEARVSRRVLLLNDRTIGLLAEILLAGRARGDLARDVDVLASAPLPFRVGRGCPANGRRPKPAAGAPSRASRDVLPRNRRAAAAVEAD
jgi:AcrR family transcriptional regulator